MAQELVYNERRREFIETMQRAGLSEAQIRARIGAVTRQRNDLRRYILSEVRGPLLGDRAEFHGSDPDQREELARLKRVRDQSYLDFIAGLADLGVDEDEAINFWFSP